MNLLQLKYFQTVAKLEHLSKAAAILQVPQPSLTQTIHRLEKELKVPLFDRKGRGMILNTYGKIWLVYVDKIFNDIEEGKTELLATAFGEKHKINIAFRAASMLATDILSEITATFPNANINVSSHLDKCNLSIHCSWSPDREPYQENLLHERIRIALPVSHPLAEKKILSKKDISTLIFVVMTADNPIYNTVNHYLSVLQLKINADMHIENPNMLCSLVAEKGYAAFIPTLTWRNFRAKNVTLHDIENCSMDKYVYLQRRPQDEDNFIINSCKEIIEDYFAQLQKEL